MPTDVIAAAGIIHDMRNLMTVISINSEMLSQQLDREQSPLATEITEAAEYLESLLESLAPRSVETLAELPTSEFGRTLRQVATFARTAHPNVEFILPDERVRFDLRIDQDELLRCLMNLVGNAAEAAIANTRIRPTVEISAIHSNRLLCIHVIDSGNGFPCDPSKAFDPYISERPNTSAHRGLGLYVVKSIVESNGGSVRVERNSSRTEVRVEFPDAMLV